MIPVADLRSLWASFLANPAQLALELVAIVVIYAVAIVVYRKFPVKYRVPLVVVYIAASLLWAYWPRPPAAV